MLIKKQKLIFYTIILWLVCSCSGKKSTSSIEISFQSKSNSSQSITASDIDILIVNVSGPGIQQTIVAQKECHEDGVLCNSITVDNIPTGSARLIQLLVVTKESDDGTQGSSILYGDSVKELSGETSVPIQLVEKASFDNEAELSGRYIPKAGHSLSGKFLTGAVDVSVSVDPNKPSMTIGTAEIFAGWFNLFVLDNVNFKFHFTGWDENGAIIPRTEIFNDFHGGEGFNIAKVNSNFTSTSKKIAKFNFNGNYMEQRESNNFVPRKFDEKIFAFFDGLTSSSTLYKEVCYDSTSFSFDNSVPGFEGRSICKTVGGGVCTDFLDFNNSGNSNTEVVGSMSAANANCAVNPTLKWELDIKNLIEKEEFSGFLGLFVNNSDVSSPVIELDGATFHWKANPKVTMNGFHILKKVSATFDDDTVRIHGIGEGYDCKKMKEAGFTVAATVAKNASHVYSYDAGAATDMEQLRLAICPLAPNGEYYKAAYFYNGYHNNQNGNSQINFAFEIFDSTGAGTGLISSINPLELKPIEGQITNEEYYYIKIHNSNSESLFFSGSTPVHLNYNPYYSVVTSASVTLNIASLQGTVPSALTNTPRCSNVPIGDPVSSGGLDSSGELVSGGSCFFELKVSVTSTVTVPETYYDKLTFDFVDQHANLNFVTPIAPILEDTTPSGHFGSSEIMFDAPNGQTSVKAFILKGTSNTMRFSGFNIVRTIPGLENKFEIDGDCLSKIQPSVPPATSLNMGEKCSLIIRYFGDGANTSADSFLSLQIQGFSLNGVGPADEAVMLYGSSSFTFVPTVAMTGGIMDVGDISTTHDVFYSIQNNSGHSTAKNFFVGSPGDGLISPSPDIQLLDDSMSPGAMSSCWIAGLPDGSTCSFYHRFTAPASPMENHMFFLYEQGLEYRFYEYGIHFE